MGATQLRTGRQAMKAGSDCVVKPERSLARASLYGRGAPHSRPGTRCHSAGRRFASVKHVGTTSLCECFLYLQLRNSASNRLRFV